MGLMSKTKLAQIVSGGLVVTTVAWGSLQWAGTSDIQFVKDKYNYLMTQYNTATSNISIYKTELARRAGLISDSQAKADILAAKVKQLEAQLENAQNGSTSDKQTIAQLRGQITKLQTQIDNGITEEDFQGVLNEVTRLEGQLKLANKEVAELKAYIDGQNANVKEITAVTAEQVQNDVDVQNLYYTWQTTTGGTDNVTTYLDGLNVIDEMNESPVAIQQGTQNTYSIGNLRAFAKLYDKVNGQGTFATIYANEFAKASGDDMDMNSRIATAMSNISVSKSIDGKNITFRWAKNVIVTPNGQAKDYNAWFNMETGALNI